MYMCMHKKAIVSTQPNTVRENKMITYDLVWLSGISGMEQWNGILEWSFCHTCVASDKGPTWQGRESVLQNRKHAVHT